MLEKNIAKPLVLHVGYSKCMSTWIQDVFRGCDEVNYLFKSGYFGVENDGASADDYFALYPRHDRPIYLESDELILLPGVEADLIISTTTLRDLRPVLDRIKSVGPNTRLLVIVREQVGMINSRYAQFIKGGGSIDFPEFFDRLVAEGRYENYLDYRYEKVFELMRDIMGSESVFIINQGNFDTRSSKDIERLEIFLDFKLPRVESKGRRRLNRSPTVRALKVMRILNRLFVKRKRSFEGRAVCRGDPVGYWVWKILSKLVERTDAIVASKTSASTFVTELHRQQIENVYASNQYDLQAFRCGTIDEFLSPARSD